MVSKKKNGVFRDVCKHLHFKERKKRKTRMQAGLRGLSLEGSIHQAGCKDTRERFGMQSEPFSGRTGT